MTTHALHYCWRCDAVVRAQVPWPHWRAVKIVWWASIALIAVLSPVMGSDYCVMIPTMMGIIVAGGPIHRYAAEKPSCCVCSAELRDGGPDTGVRPKAPRRQ